MTPSERIKAAIEEIIGEEFVPSARQSLAPRWGADVDKIIANVRVQIMWEREDIAAGLNYTLLDGKNGFIPDDVPASIAATKIRPNAVRGRPGRAPYSASNKLRQAELFPIIMAYAARRSGSGGAPDISNDLTNIENAVRSIRHAIR